MQRRSRLKNIINKSKEISNKSVGDSFDYFKKSLPIEIDDNYRLKAAWKAYGSPKNYKEALWQGLIQPIDENTFKLPSIGYNEETDEYEYLNKGRENETVAKDIRVWDNNVIPLVQELKQGGFIRIYDEEKDCWKYSKSQEIQTEQGKVINSFQKGGKPKKVKDDSTYAEFIATLPPNLQKGNDGENGYRMRYAFDNSPDVWTFDDAKGKFINWDERDQSWHGASVFGPTGEFLKPANHNTTWMEEAAYMSSKPKLIVGKEDNGNPENYVVVPMTGKEKEDMDNFRSKFNLIKTDENGNPLKYWKYVLKQSTQLFKQGGQMNVIPEGALHARKNNMELAKEGEITHKGVPVVDNNGVQQAEVEKEEWTMTKELTEDVEAWYKKYYDEETSQKDKDELAIKCGKRITKELLYNTDDRANLIAKMLEEEE